MQNWLRPFWIWRAILRTTSDTVCAFAHALLYPHNLICTGPASQRGLWHVVQPVMALAPQ